jgi:hypothetical protein
MAGKASDLLTSSRGWGYHPGPKATDHHDLFPADFEWGEGDDDNPIFEAQWPKIAARHGVVCLRFKLRSKFVSDEVWVNGACIVARTWFTGVSDGLSGQVIGTTVPDEGQSEGLFELTDDNWMLLACKHAGVKVVPIERATS